MSLAAIGGCRSPSPSTSHSEPVVEDVTPWPAFLGLLVPSREPLFHFARARGGGPGLAGGALIDLVPLEWGMHLAAQVDELRAGGSDVETIFPDSDSEHRFGANAMDPSLRQPAARAGYDQGRALPRQLTDFWR